MRNMDDILNEALAIYHLTYDHAAGRGSISNCSFAWKVAGSALFKFHHDTKSAVTGERTFPILESVLKEIL